MELMEFQQLKEHYKVVDTDGKIDIFTTTDGLTQTQYRELLQLFPLGEISRLEDALR